MSEEYLQEDPAGRSLSEALNLSLKILKAIMVLLLLLFLSSGIFTVKENQEAIVLLFGEIRNKDKGPVLKPGLHWSWPYPFSEVIKIPTTQLSFRVDEFWYKESQKKNATVSSTLDPIEDGYCLTGDANILHCKWQVRYRVENSYLYVTSSVESDKFLVDRPRDTDFLLNNLACCSIVEAAATFSAQDAIKMRKDDLRRLVQGKIEEKVERLKLGLKIEGVELIDIVPPRQVREAFESVTQAEREYHRETETAEKERTQTLAQARADATQIVKEAENYRFETEKEAESDAKYFLGVISEYRQNSAIFWERHYQRVLESIPEKVQEIFLLREARRELRLQFNRNPDLYRIKPSRED